MEKRWLVLLGVFLLVLAARLFFTFQTPYLTSDSAYLHTRIIDNLRDGTLLFDDPLGFNGRTLIHSPLFDMIIAVFTLFMPISLATKIIPAIFASLLVFPTYLLARILTKDENSSIIAATLAGITPFFFAFTFNHLSSLTLSIPLFFFILYFWTRTPKNITIFLILITAFVFLTPLSLIFIATLAIYFALCAIDRIQLSQANFELGLFTIAFTLWAHFLFYKQALLTHGFFIIWQNIPSALLGQYYSETNILSVLFYLGIFVMFFGTYAVYKYAIKKPQKESTLLVALGIVSVICLWLKLIPFTTALILLGITFTILSSQTMVLFSKYTATTKLKKFSKPIYSLIALILILTTIIPAYTLTKEELATTITEEDFEALIFVKYNFPEESRIIAPASFGHYISAIANRANIIDTHFLLQPNVNERYNDIERLYKTPLETEAITIFSKYNATHLLVPSYLPNIKFQSQCFKRLDFSNVHIYQKNPECKLEVVA